LVHTYPFVFHWSYKGKSGKESSPVIERMQSPISTVKCKINGCLLHVINCVLAL